MSERDSSTGRMMEAIADARERQIAERTALLAIAEAAEEWVKARHGSSGAAVEKAEAATSEALATWHGLDNPRSQEAHIHDLVEPCPECGLAVFYCRHFENYFHLNPEATCFLHRRTHGYALKEETT